jgi:hypothetical protein
MRGYVCVFVCVWGGGGKREREREREERREREREREERREREREREAGGSKDRYHHSQGRIPRRFRSPRLPRTICFRLSRIRILLARSQLCTLLAGWLLGTPESMDTGSCFSLNTHHPTKTPTPIPSRHSPKPDTSSGLLMSADGNRRRHSPRKRLKRPVSEIRLGCTGLQHRQPPSRRPYRGSAPKVKPLTALCYSRAGGTR